MNDCPDCGREPEDGRPTHFVGCEALNPPLPPEPQTPKRRGRPPKKETDK